MHPSLVRLPPTHLQTVSQIAKCIREVWLQFQCHFVGSNGFWDISRVLVNGSKVGVCISEGRVDLYGPGIALDGSCHVAHLLQSVAHVAVGIGKGRLDPTVKPQWTGRGLVQATRTYTNNKYVLVCGIC